MTTLRTVVCPLLVRLDTILCWHRDLHRLEIRLHELPLRMNGLRLGLYNYLEETSPRLTSCGTSKPAPPSEPRSRNDLGSDEQGGEGRPRLVVDGRRAGRLRHGPDVTDIDDRSHGVDDCQAAPGDHPLSRRARLHVWRRRRRRRCAMRCRHRSGTRCSVRRPPGPSRSIMASAAWSPAARWSLMRALLVVNCQQIWRWWVLVVWFGMDKGGVRGRWCHHGGGAPRRPSSTVCGCLGLRLWLPQVG
jgi:hypothetical protein